MSNLIVVDYSGAAPGIFLPAKVADLLPYRVIAEEGWPLPKGLKPGHLLSYKTSLQTAFSKDESIQHTLDGWLHSAKSLTLYGEGYGLYLVALAGFYRNLPMNYVAPDEPLQMDYFPMTAALAHQTWLGAKRADDPRLPMLKGAHLKGRLLFKEFTHHG